MFPYRLLTKFSFILFAVALAGSARADDAMTITSQAFAANAPIPKIYTCDGKDVSPPLAWSHIPANAKSLALIVDDPDAPDPAAPTKIWAHWVVFNLPVTANGLAEAVTRLPSGAQFGISDFTEKTYHGPCPPVGRHRYRFKLYALNTYVSFPEPPTKAVLEQAMQGHLVGQTMLIGTYAHAGQ